MDKVEARAVMSLAIGRLLRIMSRETQPGDLRAYYDARSAVLEAAGVLGIIRADHRSNYARDRLRGAQGD